MKVSFIPNVIDGKFVFEEYWTCSVRELGEKVKTLLEFQKRLDARERTTNNTNDSSKIRSKCEKRNKDCENRQNMYREILFKAKGTKNCIWVEGCYILDESSTNEFKHRIQPIADGKLYASPVNPDTICQWTWLTDKNGKKIWENDILKCDDDYLLVQWNSTFAGWCLRKNGWMHDHFFGEACDPKDCEVVGNLFDNPDLLEV